MLVFVDTNGRYPVVPADLVLRSVEIGRVVTEMAAHRRRPPMTPGDILDRLKALGLSAMVGALRQSDRDSAG
jgi:hypothetical protein